MKQNQHITVAFDFDGVIHGYSKGWQNGECYDEPVKGSIQFLKEQMALGVSVFIFTTRDVNQVAEYMQKHAPEIPVQAEAFPESIFWNTEGVVLITNRKLAATHYIDDRAIRFRGSWENVRNSMWYLNTQSRVTEEGEDDARQTLAALDSNLPAIIEGVKEKIDKALESEHLKDPETAHVISGEVSRGFILDDVAHHDDYVFEVSVQLIARHRPKVVTGDSYLDAQRHLLTPEGMQQGLVTEAE